jgi:hypothetical protein
MWGCALHRHYLLPYSVIAMKGASYMSIRLLAMAEALSISVGLQKKSG